MKSCAGKVFVLFAVIALLIPVSGFSTGLGIYIPTWGNGTATVTTGDSDFEYDYDLSHFGFGFVMDTRVARAGVFNYRLNLGYESVDYGFANDESFSRFALDNTFGFGIVQTRVIRVWLGPQIRIGYMHYKNEYDSGSTETVAVGLGLAPVLGININLGSVISICPEVGYRFEFYGGETTYDYESFYYTDSSTDDFVSANRELYLKLSIIFRIGDVYDDFY